MNYDLFDAVENWFPKSKTLSTLVNIILIAFLILLFGSFGNLIGSLIHLIWKGVSCLKFRPKNPNKYITEENLTTFDIIINRFSFVLLIVSIGILIIALIVNSQPRIVMIHEHRRPDKVLIGVYQQNRKGCLYVVY